MARLYKKKQSVTDKATGGKVVVESKKWWGRYKDSLGITRYKPLSTNQNRAQQMLNQIVEKVEKEKAGMIDPTEEEMRKPIHLHVGAYELHMKAKNNTAGYIGSAINRIKRFIHSQNIRTVHDVKAPVVEKFLMTLREDDGLSLESCNHHIRSIKGFIHWMHVNERLNRDPLVSISRFNVSTDRRHDRRPLAMEEFLRMYDAAKTGLPVAGLKGMDRAMLYLLAAWTGFRKAELGSLTLRSFNLKMNHPTVTIQAAYSKHRREDVQILHPDVVKKFLEWLEIRRPESEDEILFPISLAGCGVNRRTSGMMVFDLAAARRFWIAETEDKAEQKKRLASDFLKYQDTDGKFADFHALRHTFITNLGLANVAPKTAQTLARHSDISLTMNIYSHINIQEQADAIKSLPGLTPKK